MSLPECISSILNQRIESPRTVFKSKRRPQGFTIEEMDTYGQKIYLRFDSGTIIQPHFWRFNLVVNRLREAEGNFIMVGSRIDPEKADTIESMLYHEALQNKYPGARLRTAAFVCDILIICGFAEYGLIENLVTGRKVQAIRWMRARANSMD